MIYFKDGKGNVFGYETHEDRDVFGTDDLVQMTDLELNDHAKEPPTDPLAVIANERFNREVAGTIVGGMAVYTDRTTQAKLTSAAVRAGRDSTYTVNWKLSDGSFTELHAQQLLYIADAVGDYVQGCYDRESELVAAVANNTYTESMLTEGWPT